MKATGRQGAGRTGTSTGAGAQITGAGLTTTRGGQTGKGAGATTTGGRKTTGAPNVTLRDQPARALGANAAAIPITPITINVLVFIVAGLDGGPVGSFEHPPLIKMKERERKMMMVIKPEEIAMEESGVQLAPQQKPVLLVPTEQRAKRGICVSSE
jgi:hypothetical protein